MKATTLLTIVALAVALVSAASFGQETKKAAKDSCCGGGMMMKGHSHSGHTKDAAPAKSATKAAKSAKAKVTYTCPMHPEVKSDKPGSCPKCKMDLVLNKTGE